MFRQTSKMLGTSEWLGCHSLFEEMRIFEQKRNLRIWKFTLDLFFESHRTAWLSQGPFKSTPGGVQLSSSTPSILSPSLIRNVAVLEPARLIKRRRAHIHRSPSPRLRHASILMFKWDSISTLFKIFGAVIMKLLGCQDYFKVFQAFLFRTNKCIILHYSKTTVFIWI